MPAEFSTKRNSAFKQLEFLALKWAVTQKFSDHLVANQFKILTDNNPLTYVLSSAKLDATGQRWASALYSHYNFDISYRAGLRNGDADGLSRYPYHRISVDSTERMIVEDPTVKAICSGMTPVYIETLPMATLNITEVLGESGQTLAQKDMREIRTT